VSGVVWLVLATIVTGWSFARARTLRPVFYGALVVVPLVGLLYVPTEVAPVLSGALLIALLYAPFWFVFNRPKRKLAIVRDEPRPTYTVPPEDAA